MSKPHVDNRNIRVMQFLDAYEKQETLWNPSLETYKNKTVRDEAYMNIIRELNVPSLSIHDVKLKVKSIRTTYTKELRQLTKHKQEGTRYCPKLFWFSRANAFLKDVSLSRDKRVTFPTKLSVTEEYKPCVVDYITEMPPCHAQNISADLPDDVSNQEHDDTSPSTFDSFKTLRTTVLDTHIPNDIDMSDTDVEQQEHSDNSTVKHSAQHHQHTQDDFVAQTHMATSIGSSPKFTTTATTEVANAPASLLVSHQAQSNQINSGSGLLEDDYDIFCRSVCAQLRSISDSYSRSVAKLKIQQILFEAETGHYRNSPCITIPVSQHLSSI